MRFLDVSLLICSNSCFSFDSDSSVSSNDDFKPLKVAKGRGRGRLLDRTFVGNKNARGGLNNKGKKNVRE